MRHAGLHNRPKRTIGQIRRNLHQQRRAFWQRRAARIDGGQNRGEPFFPLQIAQAWRIGGGDIDGDVISVRRQRFIKRRVIAFRIGAFLVDPDIRTENPRERPRQGPQPREIGIEPGIIEAHAVDHGLVFGQAKQPRARIACLRTRGDRAGFHEAKTEAQQGQDCLRILIKAGSQAKRIAEAKAHDFRRQAWMIRAAILAGKTKRKRSQRNTMGGFSIHAAHQRHKGGGNGGCHGALLPRTASQRKGAWPTDA